MKMKKWAFRQRLSTHSSSESHNEFCRNIRNLKSQPDNQQDILFMIFFSILFFDCHENTLENATFTKECHIVPKVEIFH